MSWIQMRGDFSPMHSSCVWHTCFFLMDSGHHTETNDQNRSHCLYDTSGPPKAWSDRAVRTGTNKGLRVGLPRRPRREFFHLKKVALVGSNSTQLLAPVSAAWCRRKYREFAAVLGALGGGLPVAITCKAAWDDNIHNRLPACPIFQGFPGWRHKTSTSRRSWRCDFYAPVYCDSIKS